MFYVFHGEDEFSRTEELGRLRARIAEDGVGELNITSYEGRALSICDLINACNTLPFFTERRLIIVTDMLSLYDKRSGRASDDAARLVSYLPQLPESTRLVFDESTTLSSDRGVLHQLAALPNGYIREFPRLDPRRPEESARLRRWVQARAGEKGEGIEPAAADRLIQAVGNDLRQLDAELEKLAGRANFAREIRVDDVADLVTPNPEARIFEMLDAMGMRARSRAISSLHDLIASEPRFSDGLYTLAMIVIRLGDLLTIKDLAETQGLDAREVCKTMKIREWQRRRLDEQARLYSTEQLVALVSRALEIDQGIKTGSVEPMLSLELLIVEATRQPAQSARPQRERYRSRSR